MTDPSDWADAYIEQARADLAAAEFLDGQHLSVLGMLLQMTFEKIAKAALLYGSRISVEDTQKGHRSALSLMKIFKDVPFLLERVTGTPPDPWHAVVVTVENLTRFHPQVSESGPCLEYPWHSDTEGEIRWPERDLTPALRSLFNTENQHLGRLPDVFRFAHMLCDSAGEVFHSRPPK